MAEEGVFGLLTFSALMKQLLSGINKYKYGDKIKYKHVIVPIWERYGQ
ncbi:hypothetical protein ACFPQ1_25525 [Rhodocytophaga aerolata]